MPNIFIHVINERFFVFLFSLILFILLFDPGTTGEKIAQFSSFKLYLFLVNQLVMTVLLFIPLVTKNKKLIKDVMYWLFLVAFTILNALYITNTVLAIMQ